MTKFTWHRVAEPPQERTFEARFHLLENGHRTGWELYSLRNTSEYFKYGPFGFTLDNDEPQFPTLEAAQNALIVAYVERG